MRSALRWCISRITSLPGAIILMGAVAALSIGGAVLPAKDGAPSFYRTPGFLIPLCALAAGLAIFSLRRLSLAPRFVSRNGRPLPLMYRWWGNTLFHLGLAFLAVSAAASSLTRVTAVAEMVEGQSMDLGDPDALRVDAPVLPALSPPSFALQLLNIRKERGTPTANIALSEPDPRNDDRWVGTITPHDAVSFHGYAVHLDARIGYAAHLVLDDSYGNTADSYTSYPLPALTRGDDAIHNDFILPYTPFDIVSTFSPSVRTSLADLPPDGPAFIPVDTPTLRVHLSLQGTTLFSGTLPLHGAVSFSGFTLSFPDVKYLAGFRIVRDPWLTGIIAGICMALAGMAARVVILFRSGA